MIKLDIERKLNSIRTFYYKRVVPVFLAALMITSSSPDFFAYAATNNEAASLEVDEGFIFPVAEGDTGNTGSTDDKATNVKIEMLNGYTTKTEDDTYVWEAENPLAGHSFVFNILLETSGTGTFPTGTVNITIPASAFGSNLDLLEMSVPYYTQITDDLGVDHKWAYKYDDEGNIVIYNIKDIDAGKAYNFNVAYTTTQKTYYYEDMKPSEDIYAELVVYDKDPSNGDAQERYTDETDKLHVAIDTTAKINQTTKKSPSQMYTTWNDLWGEEVRPVNDGDYYYLVWEVESVIDTNSTQYYDFSLSDLGGDFKVKSVSPSDAANKYDSSELMVLGYNYSGQGNTYRNDLDKVEDQDIFGVRRDYVLTAVPKEWYDGLEENENIVLENAASATIHPADNDDANEDKTVSSSQTYTLQKPKFTAPTGSYQITKKGDRRNYKLDKFVYDGDDVPDYVYDITMTGYSYADTFEYIGGDGDGKGDHKNYGKKKLHYEIIDDEISITGRVGEKDGAPYKLTEEDYYFTYIDINYDINMVKKDDPFDDASKIYNLTKPNVASDYQVSLDIYGKFEGSNEYKKIATVDTYRYSNGAAAIKYADGMDSKAKIVYRSDRNIRIGFEDDANCTGYKIVTSDECYYSVTFNIQTGMQLKRTESLLKWINESYYDSTDKTDEEDENRITELQLTNKANMAVYYKTEDNTQDSDANLVTASKQSATGTDYQNESKRQSSITKTVTAVKNNPLYKRYEISWRIDISEIVLGEGNTPVTQNGGTFYDLLPQGSSVDLSTVQVYKENNILVESTPKVVPGSGNRVLLKVVVDEDQQGDKYSLVFTSYHTWDDISAFGTNVLNPAAYVSGNDDMADLSNGTRGNDKNGSIDLITQSILSTGDFDKKQIEDKAIFNYATYAIKALVSSNVGVSKSVKNAKEGGYSTETIVDHTTQEYSYSLRIQNGTTTKSIENIFVDFLESYSVDGVSSAWKGKLKSVDVTNLIAKNIIPVIYYSTTPFVVDKNEVYYENGNQKIYLVEGSSDITAYDTGEGKAGFYYQGIRNFLPTTTREGNTVTGASNDNWQVLDPEYCTNGIYTLPAEFNERITAIAIDFTYADMSKFDGQIEKDDPDANNDDARVKSDGRYIMGLNEAAYVILTMDGSDVYIKTKNDFSNKYIEDHPGATKEEIEQAYLEYVNGYNAYNDIFMASKYYDRMQNDSELAIDSFIEQSYTTVSHRIRSDFHMLKVDSEHTEKTVGGITFNLKGISDYGTPVDMTITTTSNGKLEFEDLEIGTYTLTETDSGRDWLRDNTEYAVSVNSDGTVTVFPDPYEDSSYDKNDHSSSDHPFILGNTPRIHADISFDKRIFNGSNVEDRFGNVVSGARFMLSGDSDYSNRIEKFAVSDLNGRVVFEDVEQGTYELKEIEAPEGYALSNVVYEVIVDKNGNWRITDTSDTSDPDYYTLLDGNPSNGYTIGNEKYQEFFLQKRSTKAVGKDNNIYLLDGAVFNLQGTTNDGDIVNVNVTSEFSAKYGDGVAHFGNLEPGTYYLREVTPPTYTYINSSGEEIEQKFYLDETIYTVEVDTDGIKITDPSGKPLVWATDSDDKIIDEVLYDFPNTPVGRLVVVRKVWVDDLTSDERIETVDAPDIVISRDPPEPFENVYAEFDYSYTNAKQGNLGKHINNNKSFSGFMRYPNKKKVTFSVNEVVEANGTTYPKLLIDGEDVGAVIVSTARSPKPIYGWVKDGIYYWYTEATAAKMPTARDLFTQTAIKNADFDGVNFSETESFAYMFNGCRELESVTNLRRPADAKTGVSAERMFLNCNNLAINGTLSLSEFDTTGITDMTAMFQNAIQNGSGSVINWGKALHTESVTSFSHMFDASTKLISLNVNEININGSAKMDYMFCNCTRLTSIPKLVRASNAYGNISLQSMFQGCSALTELNLSSFYTSGVTNMASMFFQCEALKGLDLSHFDTSSVTNMGSMFRMCKALKELELSHFDTGNVTDMSYMFATCIALTTIDFGENLNTDKVKTFSNMFDGCEQLASLNVDEIKIPKLASLDLMFYNCKMLTSIPKLIRSQTDESGTTSADRMFMGCEKLETMDLSKFDTANITNFYQMFYNCKSLREIKLDVLDANSVSNANGLAGVFSNCQVLSDFPTLKRDHIENKSFSMANMFENCYALKSVNFSQFDSVGVTNLGYLFFMNDTNKSTLSNVQFDNFDTSRVTNMSFMFRGCRELQELDLSSFTISEGLVNSGEKSITNMFFACPKLGTIYTAEEFDLSKISSDAIMFQDCKLLKGSMGTSYEKLPSENNDRYKSKYAHIDEGTSNPGYFSKKDPTTTSNEGENENKTAADIIINSFSLPKITVFGVQDDDTADGKIDSSILPYAAVFAAQDDVTAYGNEEITPQSTADSDIYRNSDNHNNQSYYGNCGNGDNFYIFKSKADLDALQEKIKELQEEIAGLESDESKTKELTEKKELLNEYEEVYTLVKNLAVVEVEQGSEGGTTTTEEWDETEWIYIFTDVVGENFYAWEDYVPGGYICDYDNFLDEEGNHKITNVTNGMATITNTLKALKFGSLTISKTVINDETEEDVTDVVNTQFAFEITLSSTADISPQTLKALYYKTEDGETSGEEMSVLFVNGKATVNIQGGYSLKFTGLPEGTTYTVQEVQVNTETVTSTTITSTDTEAVTTETERKTSGAIVADTDLNIQYKNAIEVDLREKGAFKLEKHVVNKNGDVDPEYEYVFTITFANLAKDTEYNIYKTVNAGGKEHEEIVQTFKSNNDKTATIVVKLKDSDVLTFKDIPHEATYSIIEEDSEAYISSYEITDSNDNVKESAANPNANMSLGTATQTMSEETDGNTVTFTNNIVKTQQVVLTKIVGGDLEYTEDEEKRYTFYAEFTNLGAGYTLDAGDRGMFTADAQGTASFQFFLKASESITFTNVPVGAGYVIYEECEGELIPYYEVYYTDETSGESQKVSSNSASPSTKNASEIAKDITNAELAGAEPGVVNKERGNSYLSGTVELHKNTDIKFYNNNPINLTIDKTAGEFVDKTKEFGFKVIFFYNGELFEGSYKANTEGGARLTDSDYQTDAVVNEFDDEGAVYFVLRHGSKITFEGLPYGTTYKIIEAEYEDHKASYTTDSGNGAGQKTESNTAEGMLTEETGITVHFTNDWDGEETEKPGNLQISKTITTNEGVKLTETDKNKEFIFTVKLTLPKEAEESWKDGRQISYIKTTNGETTKGKTGLISFTETEMSGTYTAEVTLKHGETITLENLPGETTYEVTETETGGYVLKEKNSDKGKINSGETQEATFENRKKTGTLTVTKTVTGNVVDTNEEFSFIVRLSGTTDSGINSASINDTFGDMTFTGGKAEFKLKHGESKQAKGLPSGISYTVEEVSDEDYTSSSTGETGLIKDGDSFTAAFTNERKTGDLTVSKTVVVEDGVLTQADTDQAFSFVVTLSESINGTFGDMTFTGGKAEFKLKHGESKQAKGLPAGVEYTVEETDSKGYIVTSTDENETVSSSSSTNGRIKGDESVKVMFTNTRYAKGSLTVTKTVTGRDGDKEKYFTFTVSLSDTGINGKFNEMEFENGVAEFSLKDGESKTATGLPAGITYTIAEAGDDEYTTNSTGETGTIGDGVSTTAAFINTRKIGDLTVTKTVEVEGSVLTQADEDKVFTFTVTLTNMDGNGATTSASINGKYGDMTFTNGKAEFTLKHGESVTATGLPTGIDYTVEESGNDGYTMTSKNANGTITTAGSTAAFTNTRIAIGDLTVSKIVEDSDIDTDKNFYFTVTLTDTDDNGITTGASVDGKYGDLTFIGGKAEFTLKHEESKTAIGLPAGLTYTVTETRDDKYTTSSTGATGMITDGGSAKSTFTNTRKTGNLTVTKTVTGSEGDVNKEFTFTVELTDTDNNGNKIPASINGIYGDMEFKNGIATIKLKHGESKTAEGLPSKINYTVTEQEADQDGYFTETTDASGEIEYNITATAQFTNQKTAGVMIKKEVISRFAVDNDKKFKFIINLKNENYSGELKGFYVIGDDPAIEVTDGASIYLHHGEVITIEGLPVGTEITVTEDVNSNFTASVEGTGITPGAGTSASAMVVEGSSTAKQVVEFIFKNSRTEGDLTVSKTVAGKDADKTKDFIFNVKLSGETADGIQGNSVNGTFGDMEFVNGAATFTLKDGESKSASGLPVGITYTVEETGNDGYTVTSTDEYNKITEGDIATGMITDRGNAIVAFTNTRKTGDLKVSKTVTGTGGSRTQPFHFTVTLYEDADCLEVAQTISGEYGDMTFENGVAEFDLKHSESLTATGLPTGVGYMVEETQVDGYAVRYNDRTGTIIEDTRIVTVTNENPAPDTLSLDVLKVVTGQIPTQNETFTFTLEADSDNPVGVTMPEDVEITILAGKNEGKGQFEDISFNAAGTYQFYVTEKKGSATGYTYDTTKYTIEVTVELDDNSDYHITETNVTASGGTSTASGYSTLCFSNEYQSDIQKNPQLTIEKKQQLNGGPVITSEDLNVSGGDIITYYLTVKNISQDTAYDLKVTDIVPEGLELITASVEGKYVVVPSPETNKEETTITWTRDKLDPNIPWTISFEVKVPEGQEVETQWTNIGTLTYHDEEVGDTPTGSVVAIAKAVIMGEDGLYIVHSNAVQAFSSALTVSKAVKDSDIEDSFDFSATLTGISNDKISYYLYSTGSDSKGELRSASIVDGKIDFQLKGGESITFTSLAPGTTYVIDETDAKGLEPSWVNKSGTISISNAVDRDYSAMDKLDGDIIEVSCVNEPGEVDEEKGSLVVTKTVNGNAGETDREFHFVVTIGDEIYEFTLKDGESWISENIIAGTGYTVTETDANIDGYTTTVTGNAIGTIQGNQTVVVTFINSKEEPTTEEPTTEEETTTEEPTTEEETTTEEESTTEQEPTTESGSNSAIDDTPKTGDNSHLELWMALMILSLLGILGVEFFSNRRKSQSGNLDTRSKK